MIGAVTNLQRGSPSMHESSNRVDHVLAACTHRQSLTRPGNNMDRQIDGSFLILWVVVQGCDIDLTLIRH